MSPGVRWVRPDAFGRDLDVEVEYRELRQCGAVTFELVQHVTRPKRRLFRRASVLHFHAGFGIGRRTIERKLDAVVRRAAEDGLAVRITDSENCWLGKQGATRRTGRRAVAWRERRTLTLQGPLPAEHADPVGTLHEAAARLYSELRRKESVFHTYSYAKNALLIEDPDAILFRELERLTSADGFIVASDRWDDVGEVLRLLPSDTGLRPR